MKKLFVLAAALMLLPVVANAQVKDGDPGFFFGFEYPAVDVIKGRNVLRCALHATNFGFYRL